MKTSGTFRSVEEWKSAIMTLPENSFFELLRSVFGNIKTPFNKQKLLDDLFNLLSRNEIRNTIAAYIDGQDHKIIAAVALLNEPAPGDLESFFAGELSCAELQSLLLNLEERLILYRFRDEKNLRLALNPVLETVLSPLIADSRCLFPVCNGDFFEKKGAPAEKRKKTGSPAGKSAKASLDCVSDSRILAALFSLLPDEDEPLKTEGGLRKKIIDRGKKLFPGLDLELAVKVITRLELFRAEGRSLTACGEKIEDYSGLSPAEREEYWAAGLYLCLNEPDSGSGPEETAEADGNGAGEFAGDIPGEAETSGTAAPRESSKISARSPGAGGFRFSRKRPKSAAAFIRRFLNLVEPGKIYPEITLRRLWELLEREDRDRDAWGTSLFYSGAQFSFETFLEAMEMTGFLVPRENCWEAAARERKFSGKESAPGEPVVVMDTAFSFIIYPEISFADALALGAFCSLKENPGTAVCLELTRSSAVRGFDRGIAAAGMIELLNRLSGNRLDTNLVWTLKEWEKRYAEVFLGQGIVLTLAEDRRYLAEAGPVASLIRRVLAPGVYLLSPADKSEALKALRKAGVDIIAQQSSALDDSGGRGAFSRNSFPRLGAAEARPFFSALKSGAGEGEEIPLSPGGQTDSAESIKRKFRAALEKMRLSKPEREELSARIERRLVLTETQLDGASLRYEKLEARGLDYVGKAVIAKQAIETGSVLEVFWPGQGGITNRIAGLPRTLEKKEGESILVLKLLSRGEGETAGIETGYGSAGNSVPVQGEAFRIPLGKISLLRRIKQSIFGG